MKIRKIIKTLLLLLIVTVFTMTCTARKDEYTKDGRLVLKYWEKWSGFEGDAMKKVVEEFNRTAGKEKGIKVEYILVSAIDRKMLVATAGGDPPDIAGVWSWIVNVYADKNAIMCLDPLIKENGIKESDYISFFYNLCRHRGKMWALPTTPATMALHWNKRMFREAGLDPERPPKTIAELDKYNEKLTIYKLADGKKMTYEELKKLPDHEKLIETSQVVQMGFLPFEPGWWNWSWGFWFGGTLWNGFDKITVYSPENIKAYEWVQSFPKKFGRRQIEVFNGAFAGQFASPQNAFLSGKIAMEIQGVWMYNFIRKYAPGMEWGAAAFPGVTPELNDVTIGEADVLVIPTGAPHPKKSFEFIKFVNSKKGMEMLCAGHRKFTPLKEVSDDFFIKNPHPHINVFRELSRSPHCITTPLTSIWNEYSREFNVTFSKIQFLETTPDKALKSLQDRMQKVLDRENERLKRRGKIQ